MQVANYRQAPIIGPIYLVSILLAFNREYVLQSLLHLASNVDEHVLSLVKWYIWVAVEQNVFPGDDN